MGHTWFVHVTTGPPVASLQKEAEWDQVMNETKFAFEYTTFPEFLVAHSISRSD